MTTAVSDADTVRDRDHLANSRPLPWDRACDAEQWPATLNGLLQALEASETRLRSRRSADRDRLRATLGSIVLALYAAHKADPDRWLAYSRNANDYGAAQRYVAPHATAHNAATAADFLAAVGWADHRRGSYSRSAIGARGYRSRLRARPELVAMLEGQGGLTQESIGFAGWGELIRLKSAPEFPRGPKRLVPYKDTAETRAMRGQLTGVNAFLSGFRIDVEPGEQDGPVMLERDGSEEATDLNDRAVRLYRVFNNARWDHAGRFYGGWWQGLPKTVRNRLLIDGEETIELDYRAMHPRMCYDLAGQPLAPEDDPYSLPGLEGDALRAVVKVAFNQLLNVTGGAWPRAPEGAVQALPKGLTYRALLRRIEERHTAIRHWFRSGRGVELQHIDSEIVARVLARMLRQRICCLPVHDSFIVPLSSEAMLGEAMETAYRDALTSRNAAPVLISAES